MSPDKGGGRSLPVDTSLPRWVCQNCRHPLSVVGVDSYADKFFGDPSRSGMQASSMHGAGSILGSCRMDNSFVVMPKQRSPGFPPRPRSSSQQPGNLAVSGSMNPPGQYVMPERLSTTQGATSTTDSHSNKAMEESFVVLPPAAASVYKVESSPEGGIPLSPPPGGGPASPSNMSNAGFNSSITVLKRAFDIATAQTQVEEEKRRLEGAIEEIERQCAEVNADLQEVELKSKRFEELKKRYWHEFNDFQFQLTMHQDFAEFANSMDKESGIPLEDCFKLPYKIENDKVENYSIIMSFNKPENWTKALKYLKYTLCNLKWVLFWFVGNTGFQPHRDPSVNFLSTPKLVRLKIESEFPQTPEILAFNIF